MPISEDHIKLAARRLPVSGPTTAEYVLEEISGDQLELKVSFDLQNAAFCGLNVLSDEQGKGGLSITWSGDMLNVDGVKVELNEWKPGDTIDLQVFIDKKIVEVFVNDGEYCISRQLQENFVKGDRIALTSLGGTAKLLALEAWMLRSTKQLNHSHVD